MLQTAWQGYILSCDDVLDRVIECPASCGMLTGLDGASFVWATFSRPVPIGVGGGGGGAVLSLERAAPTPRLQPSSAFAPVDGRPTDTSWPPECRSVASGSQRHPALAAVTTRPSPRDFGRSVVA